MHTASTGKNLSSTHLLVSLSRSIPSNFFPSFSSNSKGMVGHGRYGGGNEHLGSPPNAFPLRCPVYLCLGARWRFPVAFPVGGEIGGHFVCVGSGCSGTKCRVLEVGS